MKRGNWLLDPVNCVVYCSECHYIPRTTQRMCPKCLTWMNDEGSDSGSETRRLPKAGDVYRHFKGGEYEVLVSGVLHTETEEWLVVYRCRRKGNNTNLPCKVGDVYARPLDMFMSEVDHEKYPDAKQKYRMELIEEQTVRKIELMEG